MDVKLISFSFIRNKLLINIKGLLRFIFILINNAYCIPTHFLWLLTIWPIQWVHPKAYLFFEGLGFQWLLSMVAAWSYTAGYDGEIQTVYISFI